MQKFSVLLLLSLILTTVKLMAQPVNKTNMIGIHYSDLQVAQAIAGEPLYGAGASISYQNFLMEDMAFGLQLSYATGTEKYDYKDIGYENKYGVFSYTFTTKYNFLPGKFKLYIGFNLGGSFVDVDSNSDTVPYISDQNSHGMNISLPVGFNWFATKNIFVTAGYQAGIIVGNSAYISDGITGFNAGIGYYFNTKKAE